MRAAGVRRLEPWQLKNQTCTVSCASGFVASDMDDAVFKCPAPPSIPDGTLPRCVLLVCTGQKFDDLEGIAHNCDGVGLGDNWRSRVRSWCG